MLTEHEEDAALGRDLLKIMGANGADFTLTFRRLSDAASGPEGDAGVRSLFSDASAYDQWIPRWRRRLALEETDAVARRVAMRAVNPAYIPRNYRVEAVIRAAVDHEDSGPFEELLTVLTQPFEDQPTFVRYAEPPQPHERVY